MDILESSWASEFIRASRCHRGGQLNPRLVELHSTESPIGSGRVVAHDFHTIPLDDPRPRSSTYIVDGSGSIYQCLSELDVSCAAPPNQDKITIEQTGYADKWSWGDWMDSGAPVLTARLVADILSRRSIACVLVGPEELLEDGAEGITCHWWTTQAVRLAKARKLTSSPYYHAHEDGHHDPTGTRSDGFDMEALLGMVFDAFPSRSKT